jgi:hypothetical protein
MGSFVDKHSSIGPNQAIAENFTPSRLRVDAACIVMLRKVRRQPYFSTDFSGTFEKALQWR